MKADRSCPNCGSSATWFERSGLEVLLRCICGLHDIVYSQRGGVEIQRRTPVDEVRLPRRGTKLQACLRELARAFPGTMTTQQVSVEVDDRSADVASRLMILSNKGLIDRVLEGRGMTGGSTWRLSKLGQRLMNVDRED